MTYSDVGGCKEQIEKLREVVETPLLHVRYCIYTCILKKIILFIIPPFRHFTILGQKNVQNMPRYYTVEQGKNTD